MRTALILIALLLTASAASAGEVRFTAKPTATKAGGKVKIAFGVSSKTDVEMAILDATGKAVRHLAAGVLGGKKAPPKPLKAGLSQSLEWDGKDDFGKPAKGGPFKVRVRAGTGVRFGRFIGEDPCNFGSLESVVADEKGNVYIAGSRGQGNQMAMCVRVFDAEGRYLRELIPFPADLKPGAMKDIARWDSDNKSWRPRNLRNLNPDFYGQPGGYWGNPALTLLGASAEGGLLLTNGYSIKKVRHVECLIPDADPQSRLMAFKKKLNERYRRGELTREQCLKMVAEEKARLGITAEEEAPPDIMSKETEASK